MAEKKKEKKPEKKPEKNEVKKGREETFSEALVRISRHDIPASKKLYAGLTRVKGVSWGISNVVCLKLGIDRTKKIGELSKDEIAKIEAFLKNPDIYDFMKNRRTDRETGETKHYIGVELDMKKDFDIRRLKKIRSYKGVRHMAGQPVRGQRTRSHFRKNSRGGRTVRKADVKKKE